MPEMAARTLRLCLPPQKIPHAARLLQEAHLSNFDFRKFHPEVLAEFISEEPLIPEGIPRLLTEQTVKVKGEVWRIHKNDVDPFPSVPHAHNYESGVVLHLGSGEMFDKNRQSIGNIGCKKLLRVRGKLGSLTLPTTECK